MKWIMIMRISCAKSTKSAIDMKESMKTTGTTMIISIMTPASMNTIRQERKMVIAAVNEVIRQVEETSNAELGKITGGLNLGLPGMF